MTIRTRKRAQRLAFGAASVTAAALAGVIPAQHAVADTGPSPSAAVTDDVLVINGTDRPDNVQIGLGSDPGTLRVDLGLHTPPLSFSRSAFSAISVSLRGGDDTFLAASGGGDFTDEALTVDGGNGNDTITGGAGNDVLYGGNGDDTILGGSGSDVVFGANGDDTIDGGRGTDVEFLGRGDDVARWDPGEGNDVVAGGAGSDTLAFNGASGNERFVLSANGSGDVLTRDLGNIRMDLDQVEALQLNTLGGADTVTVHDLRGTALTQAAVDLSVAGRPDAQPDTIVAEGSTGPDNVDVSADGPAVDVTGLAPALHITGGETLDQLRVNTGAGDDAVHVANAATQLIGVSVDLGADQS